MTSASSVAANAWPRMEPWKASSLFISMPPVSTSMKWRPFHSASW